MAARAGVFDVDWMLDALTPKQFDEWVAFRQLEPDPDEWLRDILKEGFAGMCSALSGTAIKPDRFDRWAEKENEGSQDVIRNPKQAAAMIRQQYASGMLG